METAEQGTPPPDVLVILTDQQRWDTVGAYGSPLEATPNLDRLAQQGIRFANAFTCQPVCAPARACLQTGTYATTNGVWRNGLPLAPGQQTLAHLFKEGGYDVGYIGKWHLAATGDQPVPAERRGGYVDYWEAADLLEFTSQPYGGRLFGQAGEEIMLEGYRVDALTERALRVLRQPHDRPLFLFLSYLEPHHQNDSAGATPDVYVAPEGYAARFANPWVPPDLLGRPGDWLAQLPAYYGAIARIDECVGRLLRELDALGRADQTLVFFTSDHGCHFRTRNDEYKRSCHDASIRVPAILRAPGRIRGRVIEELVSLVDVAPTLLDMAGLAVPSWMQGRSMAALLHDGQAPWPEEVFVQISEAEAGRALRTRRWKYAVFAPERDPWRDPGSASYQERCLYDLAADPHERVNLIGRSDHATVAATLRERLMVLMRLAGEDSAEIVPAAYPVA
jgi:arylsulfatase A-like enzyme